MIGLRSSLLILLVAIVATVVQAQDCGQHQDCTTCLLVSGCSWCHTYVYFPNGTVGPRCTLGEEMDCPGTFDVNTCTSGWLCNYETGLCEKSIIPGEGDPSYDQCLGVGCAPTNATYKCNTNAGKCEPCDATLHDPNCYDSERCSFVCNPNPGAYKCSPSQECVSCSSGETDCGLFVDACLYCHPPVEQYQCDAHELQCVKVPSGGYENRTCDAFCNPSFPSEIAGYWRGIAAQKDYPNGIYEFTFDNAQTPSMVEIVYNPPTGSIIDEAGRCFRYYGLFVNFTEGPFSGNSLAGIMPSQLAQGQSIGSNIYVLAFSGLNQPPPDSAEQALVGGQVFIITAGGNFDLDGTAKRRKQRRALARVATTIPDPCSNFSNCTSCIGQSLGQVKCGWCMGGNITYNDTGIVGTRCGGYTSGDDHPFACPYEFRTSGDGCDSYSCNYDNGTCSPCDPSDTSCKAGKGNCQHNCPYLAFGQCDPVAGMCYNCSSPDIPGCIRNCDANCYKTATFDCVNGMCRAGAGTMTGSECAFVCGQNGVKCNPYGSSLCQIGGILEKNNCNTNCLSDWSICNITSGTCTPCSPEFNKDCLYSSGECKAACKPSPLPGLWRGLKFSDSEGTGIVEVIFNFTDSHEFSFGPFNMPERWYTGTFTLPSKLEGSASLPLGTTFIQLAFTSAPPVTTPGNLIPEIRPSDRLNGFFVVQEQQGTPFGMTTLALGTVNGDAPQDFTTALTDGVEFLMFRCRQGVSECSWRNEQ